MLIPKVTVNVTIIKNVTTPDITYRWIVLPKTSNEEVDPNKEFLKQYIVDKRVLAFYKLVFKELRL